MPEHATDQVDARASGLDLFVCVGQKNKSRYVGLALGRLPTKPEIISCGSIRGGNFPFSLLPSVPPDAPPCGRTKQANRRAVQP